MNSMMAFARGEASRGQPSMVFDWEKAARLIADNQPQMASAGLSGDWEWTGGVVFEDGQPVTDSYTYLASTWATPELKMDGVTVECWRFAQDTPGWNFDTKWPPEALAILGVTP